jgi:hypothetical protein
MGLYIHDLNSPRPHTGGYTCMMWTLHDLIQGAMHTWCELSTTSYMGLYIHDVNSPRPHKGGYTYTMWTLHEPTRVHIMYVQSHVWGRGEFTSCMYSPMYEVVESSHHVCIAPCMRSWKELSLVYITYHFKCNLYYFFFFIWNVFSYWFYMYINKVNYLTSTRHF